METDFIYWRHSTPCGIRVEEIFGGEDKSPKIWKAMALQVFGENGNDRYQEISHTPSGAPILEGSCRRISISHTPHFMVIASLPKTPEAILTQFNLRTALGVDAERADRKQIENIADRIFSHDELSLINDYASRLDSDNNVTSNSEESSIKSKILGWTIKEALYKAALHPALDFRSNLIIRSLPTIYPSPQIERPLYGNAIIIIPEEDSDKIIEMNLFSYMSEKHIITLAFSPKCAKFHKS